MDSVRENWHDRSGEVLDQRYILQSVLGEGGWGAVFVAHDQLLDRQVAVKILNRLSQDSLDRFHRECKMLAALRSSAVPTIHSWGKDSCGCPYIAMELLIGETLEQYLLRGEFSDEDLSEIFIQMASALMTVHANGVVHRDVKPDNFIVESGEDERLTLRLLDFGIAHLMDANLALTATEEVLGSQYYLSPEHFNPKALDGRSDLFSMGCVMYRALSGHPPYEGEAPLANLQSMQAQDRKKLSASVPEYLRYCVDKCLQPLPEQRFQSAQELMHALQTRAAPRAPLVVPGISTKTTALIVCMLVTVGSLAFVVSRFKQGGSSSGRFEAGQVVEVGRFATVSESFLKQLRSIDRAKNPSALAKQEAVLEKFLKVADDRFLRAANYEFAKELNCSACDQILHNPALAKRAFQCCDSISMSESNYCEMMHYRFSAILSKGLADKNFVPLLDQCIGRSQRAMRPRWTRRFIVLKGELLGELGDYDGASKAFAEAQLYPVRFPELNQDQDIFDNANLAIEYWHWLDKLKPQDTLAKRTELISIIFQNLHDANIPRLRATQFSRLFASAMKIPKEEWQTSRLARVISIFEKRAEAPVSDGEKIEQLTRAAELSDKLNPERSMANLEKAFQLAQASNRKRNCQVIFHMMEARLQASKADARLLGLRERILADFGDMKGWLRPEAELANMRFRVAVEYVHGREKARALAVMRDYAREVALVRPQNAAEIAEKAVRLRWCAKKALQLGDTQLASTFVSTFDGAFDLKKHHEKTLLNVARDMNTMKKTLAAPKVSTEIK